MKFKMKNKLVSVALTATTLMWAVGVAALPVANADTASTQAQIQALLAQIAQLQAQMGTSSTTTGTTTSAYSFATDLTVGSKGADVTALQQLLISKGDLTVVSAPTGYFGAATQAALAKFQTANGITPAAGYFGPKTRAFVNSMNVSTTTTTTTTTGSLPAGCTTASGYSPTTGASCSTTTTTTTTGVQTTTGVVAPASGVAVSVASSNPAAGSLISGTGVSGGAARVPVLSVNFTAGVAGGVTVSEVKFHKLGVLSDSSISGAYLTQNGKVLYQYNSLSNSVLDFSGMSLAVPAGQTVTLTLAIDVSGGLSAGNTTGFSLNSASDVTAFDANNTALTPTGMFPMNGNTFTVTTVTNPNLAALTINKGSIGGTVTAGTQSNLVYASTFNVGNSKVYLQGLNFHIIGSANKGDIRNVKLMVNGTQVGATLPTVGQDGTAYFDASATPGVLNTGNNNVQIYADVMGSPSYNFTFEILNGYDVLALDSQYNVPVRANSDSGNLVSIQQGQITTTQDPNTPSGSSISKGQSGMVLAKFDIYAAGEAVKVLYLPFSITFTGNSTTTLSNFIQNVSIVDDAGGQVGSTINLPGSSSDLTSNGATWGATTTNNVYTSSFGTSASPINYTIPANTTRVLSLKADIQPNANFSTIQAGLTGVVAPNFNLQGMISSQTGVTSAAAGNTLTLSQSSLTVTQDSSLGAQTLAANSVGQKIGSYSFTASQAEGVTVNNLSIGTNVPANILSNLKVMVNGTQFGSSQPTVGPGPSSQLNTYNFSGTPFSVPAGSTVVVGVYADVLSIGATTYPAITSVNSVSGVGAISYSSISLPSTVYGQSLTINSTGSAINVTINTSNQPSNGQISMGTSGNTLASFNFNETSNVEDIKLTTLDVVDVTPSATNTAPTFSNLTLWNGAQEVGTAQSFLATTTVGSASAFLYQFTGLLNNTSAGAYIPRNGVLNLTLKGDVNTLTSNNAVDNSLHTFEIATTSYAGAQTTSTIIVAQGATSGKSAQVTIPAQVSGGVVANATQQNVLRTTLAFSSSPVGSTSGRAKSASDVLASLIFTPGNGGSAALNMVRVTFTGSAVSSMTSFPISSTYLALGSLNSSGQLNVTTKFAASSSTTSIAGTVVEEWDFPASVAGLNLSGPTTLYLVGNTTLTNVAGANNSVSLYANINAGTDIQYTDGTNLPATPNLGLPSSVLTPIQLNGVQFQTNS
jgi:hypothetical protein